MLNRKIQNVIKEYFTSNSNKILIIDGARQIGKSFIIRHEGQIQFPNYIEVNLLEDKMGERIFAHVTSTVDFYMRLSSVAGDKMGDKYDTLVFIDEIQAYPELLTLLKFLKDEDRFTYIVSGSFLGIALNQTLSKPGGRIRVERMYPLDFEEFLWANHIGEEVIAFMREQFVQRQSLNEALHNKFLSLFKQYLFIGGLPDAVNIFVETQNVRRVRETHDEILNLYKEDAAQYSLEHSLKIKRIYELIPSYMENKKKRVYFNKIEGKKGGRSSNYEEEFEYLVRSGIAIDVLAISNPVFPLIESAQKNLLKLYLNDVGLLSQLLFQHNISAVLDDHNSVNLGSLYETAVASELLAHQHKLYYYDNKQKGEVDFLIDDYDTLSIMPLEVKSGKDYTIHRALDKFIANQNYHIVNAMVLSNERVVRTENAITYIPIYYVMFL